MLSYVLLLFVESCMDKPAYSKQHKILPNKTILTVNYLLNEKKFHSNKFIYSLLCILFIDIQFDLNRKNVKIIIIKE